jgi:hypothetical protein
MRMRPRTSSFSCSRAPAAVPDRRLEGESPFARTAIGPCGRRRGTPLGRSIITALRACAGGWLDKIRFFLRRRRLPRQACCDSPIDNRRSTEPSDHPARPGTIRTWRRPSSSAGDSRRGVCPRRSAIWNLRWCRNMGPRFGAAQLRDRRQDSLHLHRTERGTVRSTPGTSANRVSK